MRTARFQGGYQRTVSRQFQSTMVAEIAQIRRRISALPLPVSKQFSTVTLLPIGMLLLAPQRIYIQHERRGKTALIGLQKVLKERYGIDVSIQ